MEQLEQLLADCRRENQLLKDEIHPLKERVTILEEAKHQLDLEHDSDKETIIQACRVFSLRLHSVFFNVFSMSIQYLPVAKTKSKLAKVVFLASATFFFI